MCLLDAINAALLLDLERRYYQSGRTKLLGAPILTGMVRAGLWSEYPDPRARLVVDRAAG